MGKGLLYLTRILRVKRSVNRSNSYSLKNWCNASYYNKGTHLSMHSLLLFPTVEVVVIMRESNASYYNKGNPTVEVDFQI